MTAPRVAFFTDSFHEVNGVALTSREFQKFAVRQARPFFSVHAGPETKLSQDGDCTIYELARSFFSFALEYDLHFDLAFMRHLAPLREQLRRFRPDVIHVTGPSDVGILGTVLAYQLRVPLAASWHTNVHEYAARRLERKLSWIPLFHRRNLSTWVGERVLDLTLRFYKLARVLFAPNSELIDMLGARTHRPICLMERGIDTNFFSPRWRARTGKEFVIGFVGRLSPEKNVRALAVIERSLLEAGIRDCRFLIVGEGSEREWLAANLKRAEFTGVLSGEALARAYASMDTFVFPSETDTFGNVVLEAMASGVPVLVSNGGGPKYLVRSRVNGFVATSTETFVEALMDLRSHPSLREMMASQARATASSHSWDAVFEKVYDGYTAALETSGRPTRHQGALPLALAR